MNKKLTPKLKWDLNKLFTSDNDANILKSQKALQINAQKFIKKWKNKNFLKSPKILKEALDDYNKLITKYGPFDKSFYYFYLRLKTDLDNPSLKAKYQKAVDINQEVQNNLLFFTLEISKIDSKRQKQFLSSKILKPYKHFLERLFAKSKFILSEKEEKILNIISTPSYHNWTSLTNSLIAKQEKEIKISNKKVKKTSAELSTLTFHQNPKIRQESAKAFNEILEKVGDVAEAEINSVLEYKKITDTLRGAQDPDTERIIRDDMTPEIVQTLVKTVSDNFKISKQFYSLMKKLLKLKKMHYYERGMRYIPKNTKKKSYSYEESVNLVYKVFNNLDKEFGDIFYDFVTKGHIDVYPKKGKRDGAFCIHNLITHPTYIMLNHTNTLRDVTTIAHEAGHGINNELIRKNQPAIYFDTPVSTAEVASTFMEDFVLNEVIKDADDEEKLSILFASVNNDISTVFRQISFYNFEKEIHTKYREKGYLSKKEIDDIFAKHMKSYMGSAIDMTYSAKNFWIYVPHFRYYFYVYSYSSGLLISKYLQRKVKQNSSYIEKVKYFLSCGTSESPYKIFKKLGIDIKNPEFWTEGLKEIEEKIKQIKKLAKKLGKI